MSSAQKSGVSWRRTTIAAAHAVLPETYAYSPMLAAPSASLSDPITLTPGWIERPQHLVTRLPNRELFLLPLMWPAELSVAARSPLFYLLDRLTGSPRTGPSQARPGFRCNVPG
jgi:hypothetical protein